MPALVMTFLWSLLLQGGMLLGVRVFYKRWSPLKQRLVASFTLPVAVALMAAWMWFQPASCPGANTSPCPATAIAVAFALRMIGMLLVAAFLLSFIGTLRRR
jgi:hypothetical protein